MIVYYRYIAVPDRQGVSQQKRACLLSDKQVIFHLLLCCVIADAAVSLRAVVGQAVCGVVIDFLAEIDQLIVDISRKV